MYSFVSKEPDLDSIFIINNYSHNWSYYLTLDSHKIDEEYMFSKKDFKNIDLEKIKQILRQQKDEINEADGRKVLRNSETLTKIFNKVNGLKEFFGPFFTMIELLKDFFSGRYKDIPIWAISAIIVTLLYVLSPADVIPDFVPGIGYIDDISVFTYCLSLINKELKKYNIWKGDYTAEEVSSSPA